MIVVIYYDEIGDWPVQLEYETHSWEDIFVIHHENEKNRHFLSEIA